MRASITAKLKELGWSRARLARESGTDPNTVSDFLNGKREASAVTLGKLEAALGLTFGTLADSGEDHFLPAVHRPQLRSVSDAELVAELGYRIEQYRRIVEKDEDPAALERRRMHERRRFLTDINETSDEYHQWLKREWEQLEFDREEGGGWNSEARKHFEFLCSAIDALIFARDHGMALVDPEAQKSPDDGREGGSNVTPNVNQDDLGLAARHTRSRGKQLRAEMDAAGEESQDMGE